MEDLFNKALSQAKTELKSRYITEKVEMRAMEIYSKLKNDGIKVEWALRKAKVKPEVFLRSHDNDLNVGLTYLSRNALKFETKKEAGDYARCLYQDTGVAWEPIAIFSAEESNNAEKTF